MLTIFSCPKPFRGHVDITQRNAIRSWLRLDPRPDVILMGNDEGVAGVALELGVRHIPDVECNEFGTPLLSSIFGKAENASSSRLMCYVNADIIFMQDFVKGIERVIAEKPKALMVGRRWNVDIKELIEFDPGWQKSLTSLVARKGKLYPYFAIDYFVFPRNSLGRLPPFAIGRPAWDNWVIYRACTSGMAVIDMTKTVMVVHENHDYSHHPQGWKGAMHGEESKRNIAYAGEIAHAYSLLDAQYRLTQKGVVRRRFPPIFTPFYIYKNIVVLSKSYRFLKPAIRFLKVVGERITARP
ncbi:MAG: hypothetical protein LBQ00_01105 [Syntrophobacterales bacterium]|jgi:hypothetical protein|nr:hypothetical protein [Syntrophobacterales bacterium]